MKLASVMRQLVALCVALPAVSGMRVAPAAAEAVRGPRQLEFGEGVPRLTVLETSDMDEAATLLGEWSDAPDLGLFVKFARDSGDFAPRRVVLLGLCRHTRVLLLDLRPHLQATPRPFPRELAAFLEDPRRTFYGMGLLQGAAHLAFEFDTVIRSVDYRVRRWPQLALGGGLYGVANRYFETSFKRPSTLARVSDQAVHTWLQFALASYFIMFYGPPSEGWILTPAELFGAGPMYLRVEQPRHEWSEAMAEWMRVQKGHTSMDSGASLDGMAEEKDDDSATEPTVPSTDSDDDDDDNNAAVLGAHGAAEGAEY